MLSSMNIKNKVIVACLIAFGLPLLGAEFLKIGFKNKFYVGVATSTTFLNKENTPLLHLISNQFNSMTPENALKWSSCNPSPGVYTFEEADKIVEFANQNNMYMVGHVLFWHAQTPEWVFKNDKGEQISREELLVRMRERVRMLATRYKGKINGWDVVNEAILQDGKLRNSLWTKIIGEDFLEQAFRIASEEFPPEVELFYNDYGMQRPLKIEKIVNMVKEFKQKGIRIDGIGMQEHYSIEGPSIADIEKSITLLSLSGVPLHITELDINVLPGRKQFQGEADVTLKVEGNSTMDPYREGLPEVMQEKLKKRYVDIFKIYLKYHDKIKRVTFWGPNDGNSWLNNWPIKGRVNYPLLFDREGRPKPAFYGVMELIK